MMIYEKAKRLVTAREAAEHYGLNKPPWDGTLSFPRRPQTQHEAG